MSDMVLNTEAVTQRCSIRKKCAQKFQKIYRKTPVLESFKVETLVQLSYCEFWEIFKNTFFAENLRWLLLSVRLWTTKIQHLLLQYRWQYSIC